MQRSKQLAKQQLDKQIQQRDLFTAELAAAVQVDHILLRSLGLIG